MDPLTLHPRVGASALELVKRFEGLRTHAAALPQGGFVIGHGHVMAGDPGRPVTAVEAEALLRYDLSRLAVAIEPLILAPVSEPQFDVLLSFAFGVGAQAFAQSGVLKRLNAGAYLDAAAALELWRVAEVGGEPLVVDVLVRRRAAEKAHFLQPPEGFAPAPSALLRPTQDDSAFAVIEAFSAADARAAQVDIDGPGARAVLREPPGREGEPAPSPALAAVAAISARLDRLFASEPPPPPLAKDAVAAPPASPALEESERPELLAAKRAAEPGPQPGPEPGPQPGPEPANDRAPPEASPAVGRREPAPVDPRERPLSPPSIRGPAILMGLVGLLVFALAVLRIYHAPSLGGLALGVLGVVAMAPAAMLLATPKRRDDG